MENDGPPSKAIRSMENTILLSRRFLHDSPFHFCAILTYRQRLINVGYNYFNRTHAKYGTPFGKIHAEADCLIGVDEEKLNGSTMFVARTGFNNRSQIVMAKPCQWCQAMIRRAKIRQVYYSVDSNTMGLWNVDKETNVTYKF